MRGVDETRSRHCLHFNWSNIEPISQCTQKHGRNALGDLAPCNGHYVAISPKAVIKQTEAKPILYATKM